jgi:hypothetical protein
MITRLVAIGALLSLAGAAPLQGQGGGQDTSMANTLELVRSNVRTNKRELIARALALPDSQATIFWPMYREYETELAKLADERVALIREYLTVYDTLSDEKAKNLMMRVFDLDSRRTKLSRDQFKRFSKKLPPKLVAHFFQLDGFLNRVIDLQITAALPEIRH